MRHCNARTTAVKKSCSRRITRHILKLASLDRRRARNAISNYQKVSKVAMTASRIWRNASKTWSLNTSAWSRKWTRFKRKQRTPTHSMGISGLELIWNYLHLHVSNSIHSLVGNRLAKSLWRIFLPTLEQSLSNLDSQTSMLEANTTAWRSTKRDHRAKLTWQSISMLALRWFHPSANHLKSLCLGVMIFRAFSAWATRFHRLMAIRCRQELVSTILMHMLLSKSLATNTSNEKDYQLYKVFQEWLKQ